MPEKDKVSGSLAIIKNLPTNPILDKLLLIYPIKKKKVANHVYPFSPVFTGFTHLNLFYLFSPACTF